MQWLMVGWKQRQMRGSDLSGKHTDSLGGLAALTGGHAICEWEGRVGMTMEACACLLCACLLVICERRIISSVLMIFDTLGEDEEMKR